MFRLFAPLLSILLACVFTSEAAAAPQTRNSLTRDMAARIRQALPDYDVQISEPLTLSIRRSNGGNANTVNLDRVWNVCQSGDAEECEGSIANFVNAARELVAEPSPITSAQLREMVRSEDYCVQVRRVFGERGQILVTRPAPANLCAVIVADSPHSMRLLTTEDLDSLHLPTNEAWDLAERQTLDNLPQPTEFDIAHQFVMVTGQDYLPSLILAREGWRALAAAQGGVMLAVPADGRVIVLRAVDGAALEQLQNLVAQDFQTAERGISPHILRWTDQGWAIAR